MRPECEIYEHAVAIGRIAADIDADEIYGLALQIAGKAMVLNGLAPATSIMQNRAATARSLFVRRPHFTDGTLGVDGDTRAASSAGRQAMHETDAPARGVGSEPTESHQKD